MANPSIALADRIWETLSVAINSGLANSIRIPVEYRPLLGKEGLDALVAHFSRIIGATAVLKHDAATDLLSIQPPQTTWNPVLVKEVPEEESVIAKKSKLPRPPNAFILYRQHHHPIVKGAHPDLHNNQISIILGKQWRSEDTTIKAKYKRQADDLKKRHMEEHPHYQYQPRKPSEKKRRMTRRKAEALSNHDDSLGSAPTQLASAPIETPLDFEMSPVFPVFGKTPAGNSVITFGSDDFDDKTFETLIKEFNESAVAAHPRAPVNNMAVYTERTEEAQEDFTFHQDDVDAIQNSIVGLDEELDAEMTRLLGPVTTMNEQWNTMEHYDQTHHWDGVHHHDPRTELERFTTIFDEDST